MNRKEFCRWAHAELGARLERATPERLRAFLDQAQARLQPHEAGSVVEVEGDETSLEQAEREFFGQVLEDTSDRAFILLWLTAVEMWWASRPEAPGEDPASRLRSQN